MRLIYSFFFLLFVSPSIGTAPIDNEICFMPVGKNRKYPCTSSYISVDVSLSSWSQTSPPVEHCRDGFLNSVLTAFGLDKKHVDSARTSLFSIFDAATMERLSQFQQFTPYDNYNPLARQLEDTSNPTTEESRATDAYAAMAMFGNNTLKGYIYEFLYGSDGAMDLSSKKLVHSNNSVHPNNKLSITFYNDQPVIANYSVNRRNLEELDPLKRFPDFQSEYNVPNEFNRSSREAAKFLISRPAFKRFTKIFAPFFVKSFSTSVFKAIPKEILTFLSGRVILNFFASILEDGYRSPYGSDCFILSFLTKKKNLFTAACETVQQAYTRDPLKNTTACTWVNVMAAALACTSRGPIPVELCEKSSYVNATTWLPEKCYPSYGPHKSQELDTSEPIDIFLIDRNPSTLTPLPENLTENDLKDEGYTHFLLFRATQDTIPAVQRQGLCGLKGKQPDLVPGWKVELIINVQQNGELLGANLNRDTFPFAFVSRPRTDSAKIQQCQALIVMRPTLTMFEWKLDFTTNMQLFLASHKDVKGHSGFVRLMLALAPPLENYLTDLMHSCSTVHTIITGHSLGAGVGQVLALYLKTKFLPTALKISTAFYAPPNVFNAAGATLYGTLINGRSIEFDIDVVPKAPCSVQSTPSGFPRCGDNDPNILIPTGSGVDYYVKSPGTVELNFTAYEKSLGLTSTIFNRAPLSKTIDVYVPTIFQIPSTHICGYACWSSMFCMNDMASAWQCNDCAGQLTGSVLRLQF